MVVDASALVSVLKSEPTAPTIRTAIAKASTLVMASVTLTEVALVGLKEGQSLSSLAEWVAKLGIEIVAVDSEQAMVAAEARHRFPIRFGDGFVVALAKARALPVLTLDAEFAKTDVALVPLA